VTAAAAVLTAATESLLSREGLLIALGGAAGLLAILGLILLLPLYLTQREEVQRLVDWMDREPDAGTTEFRAIDPAAARQSGRMTPAERVTSERPALARISTQEQEALALQEAPLWRRVVERGPRHPLVLSLIALLVAVAVVAAAGIWIRAGDDDEPSGKTPSGVDPASVQVVVVNAGDSSGLADEIGQQLEDDGFDFVGTSVASEPVPKSMVRYAPRHKVEGGAVSRALKLKSKARSFDAEAEAAANGADVVVIAGEDATTSDGGKD
jgi:LytR cell envelope-related transcriptional attenuator